MFINGEWVDAIDGGTFAVTNPATGEEIGQVSNGGAADATAAIDAADAAFAEWSTTTAFARADILMKAWQLMTDRAVELAELMTKEQGKPLKASTFEVKYGADFIRWFAEEARRFVGIVVAVGSSGPAVPECAPAGRRSSRWSPRGTIRCPMLTRKMAPALAAGCTMVLKPAEATPLWREGDLRHLHRSGCSGRCHQHGDCRRSCSRRRRVHQ